MKWMGWNMSKQFDQSLHITRERATVYETCVIVDHVPAGVVGRGAGTRGAERRYAPGRDVPPDAQREHPTHAELCLWGAAERTGTSTGQSRRSRSVCEVMVNMGGQGQSGWSISVCMVKVSLYGQGQCGWSRSSQYGWSRSVWMVNVSMDGQGHYEWSRSVALKCEPTSTLMNRCNPKSTIALALFSRVMLLYLLN